MVLATVEDPVQHLTPGVRDAQCSRGLGQDRVDGQRVGDEVGRDARCPREPRQVAQQPVADVGESPRAREPGGLFRFAGMPPQRYPEIFACLAMVVGLYGILYLEIARRPEALRRSSASTVSSAMRS